MAVHFGQSLKESFMFDDSFVYINHGSFGVVPKVVHEKRLQILQDLESNPDVWFRYKYMPLVLSSIDTVASLINCNKDEVVFVENATSGVTTALNSLNLQPNDGLLISSISYENVKFTSDRLCKRDMKATYHILDLTPPYTSKEEVVERYRNYLSNHCDIRVAIVDHITSPSAMLLPVKDIVNVCHEFGVKVIVDGAHAPGQVQIDVNDLGAEFYVGNLHKWYFCARGCAILYIRPDQRDIARPLLASNLYLKGYPAEFYAQATRDYTPYCIVSTANMFYESIGGISEITKYCSTLREWAIDMLSVQLNQPKLPIPKEMECPYMGCVRLPSELQGDKTKSTATDILKVLTYTYSINVQIDVIMDELWIRISCGVYNVEEDYRKLLNAILDLVNNPDKLK